jgi:hypothetical protein
MDEKTAREKRDATRAAAFEERAKNVADGMDEDEAFFIYLEKFNEAEELYLRQRYCIW